MKYRIFAQYTILSTLYADYYFCQASADDFRLGHLQDAVAATTARSRIWPRRSPNAAI